MKTAEKKTTEKIPANRIKEVEKKPRFPEKDSNYDFPVEFQNLKTESGIPITHQRAIVRKDNKFVLGIVGKDYQIVTNKELITQIESSLPVALSTRAITICKGGKLMFARYKSPKIQSVEVKKGDIVSFGVELINAYTGKNAIVMRMFAERLMCTNGMTVPRNLSTIMVRHACGVNIIDARKQFEEQVKLFHTHTEQWKNWTRVEPKEIKVIKFMEEVVKQKTVKDIIMTKFEADKDKSLWGVFNAVTWYGTHVMRPRNISMIDDKTKSLSNVHGESARLQFRYSRNIVDKFYTFDWK